MAKVKFSLVVSQKEEQPGRSWAKTMDSSTVLVHRKWDQVTGIRDGNWEGHLVANS